MEQLHPRRLHRDTPLSWRLTALYVAILVTILTVLGLTLYRQVETFLINDTTNRLEAATKNSLIRAAEFRRNGGGPSRPNYPPAPSSASTPDVGRMTMLTNELSSITTVAQVLAADGTVLAGGQSFADQPLPLACSPDELRRALAGETIPPRTVSEGGAHLLVTLRAIPTGEGTVGVLQTTTTLAAADGLLNRLRLILFVGILGAIVLGGLLGISVTRAALRPLAQVTATSERIAAGELGQRTDLPGGRDEIGRLATAFDRMVDRLEETLRAQRQFVADASHELRTPLTSLGGLIEMLLLGADRGDTATVQRALRSAHREIERLSRLVGDLLTLSRLDAHPTSERKPVDLAAIVAEVGEQTRFLAGERSVTWQADGPLPVDGDADRLKQVLLNLTGNAVAFTGEQGRVALRAARRGEGVRIEVEDDGAGIAPQDLPRLFERFYRGDKSRVRRADGGGNGLGLAIAQAIVEAHGGTIAARSTLGRGTTFTVDLPLAAPPELTGTTAPALAAQHADSPDVPDRERAADPLEAGR